MNKEGKILLAIQIIISIIVVYFCVTSPEATSIVADIPDTFTKILFFLLVWWLFGALFGASLIVVIVEGYLFIKAIFFKNKNEEKSYELIGYNMFYSLIIGYVASFFALILTL